MDLGEISTGTEITIYFEMENRVMQALCRAIGPLNKGLIVTKPLYNGMPLGLVRDFSFSIRDKGNNQHKFKCALIQPVKKWNNKFYYMEGLEGLDLSDHRRAIRYPVGLWGIAYVHAGTDAKVLVYDISMRGISLVVERNAVFSIGDSIHISFKEKNKAHHLNVTADVVRKFQVDDFDAIGCRITEMGTDYMAFATKVKSTYLKKSEEADAAEQALEKKSVAESDVSMQIQNKEMDDDQWENFQNDTFFPASEGTLTPEKNSEVDEEMSLEDSDSVLLPIRDIEGNPVIIKTSDEVSPDGKVHF